jgi:hypothetical protein
MGCLYKTPPDDSRTFLIVQRRLASLRAVSPEVDSASIEQQVEAIRTALGRIRTIKTKVTELGGCAEVINEQASRLREEVKEALVYIEESIRPGEKNSVGECSFDGQDSVRQLSDEVGSVPKKPVPGGG